MRPIALALLAAPFALGACATVPAEVPAGEGSCFAERVNPWIGHVATPQYRADIAKATGAETIRWLYPDSAMTMDYRPDRLNVKLDKNTDVIRSASCG
ncbi:Peptidase inhibitor I78 family protein [Tsuneonella dongtanensis]|uniref:Peptidase inhibitor I78 family protein n=1 Tax=Tsuneonella dongtanensis TaxID=692370 RepID=A0A1B2AEL9_9SPHN|nr:I78 family peptidase inhibitor [Tsuneonella dongtanensis]ANY20597.1 Peptidase inhibitor I78 family protein [Tsuneonella dongtanensis]